MCDHLHPAAVRLAAGAGLVAAHLLQHSPGLQQTGTDRYVDIYTYHMSYLKLSKLNINQFISGLICVSPEAGVVGV